MIQVRAPSRLHFGFFSLPGNADRWPNQEGRPTYAPRAFGGIGLTLDDPHWVVEVESAKTWSSTGVFAERALDLGRKFVASLGISAAFRLKTLGPEYSHVGLGSGTQLALAVAVAISTECGVPRSPRECAANLGRGKRSAIGIEAFERGGYFVDAGKGETTTIAPCVARLSFPEDWPILLVIPRQQKGEHGPRELDAFASLRSQPTDLARTEALTRLALLHLLPAVAEHNHTQFAEAIYEFNARVGEMFAPWQGDIYSHALTGEIVRYLRKAHVPGVGQTSWGPAVFAVLEDANAIDRVKSDLERQFGDVDLVVTRANNRGAVIEPKDRRTDSAAKP